MRRLSLSTRLVGVFVAITIACFGTVGVILYQALTTRIIAQDDNAIVLSSRHLRRLATELESPADVVQHRDRLIDLMLGDQAVAMKVLDDSGQALIDYDPSGIPIEQPFVVSADHRILLKDLQNWTTRAGEPVRGVATRAQLRDNSRIVIVVARVMADRVSLLQRYRRDITLTMLLGIVLSAGLSLLLVRRALRPLHSMTISAQAITTHKLDTRMDAASAPRELYQLALSLNAMLERLEHGFARIWQFTTDLAHDLRTPIGNLRGATEVALTRPRSAIEYQILLASNLEECERVIRMIESVLFLARAENPRFAMQYTDFAVGEELARIVEYFEGLAAEANIKVQIHATARLHADRELLRRALSNLLANALRYTPPLGVIRLEAIERNGAVIISVENPGIGIAAEHLDKLFDRFYRVDKARSNSASSSGLGLAIVKTIMDLHGGQALVSSQPGGLTRFELHFPTIQQNSSSGGN
jgi:two-component system heavy metal sensor histidine kinase CusS